MKYLITYLIILSAFPTCCNDEAVETERVSLSESEIQLIPYTLKQTVNFKHSKGFTFNVMVNENIFEWNSDNFCDECCGGEYTSYQERHVLLVSEYPEFNISLSLNSLKNYGEEEKAISIDINRYRSYFKYDNDTKFICEDIVCYDEIIINDKSYFNVVESEFENRYDTDDTVGFYPQKIRYNNNFGIIQIIMSNNETYSLNN